MAVWFLARSRHIERCFSVYTFRTIKTNACFFEASDCLLQRRRASYTCYDEFFALLQILGLLAFSCRARSIFFNCHGDSHPVTSAFSSSSSSFRYLCKRSRPCVGAKQVTDCSHAAVCHFPLCSRRRSSALRANASSPPFVQGSWQLACAATTLRRCWTSGTNEHGNGGIVIVTVMTSSPSS